MEAQVEIEAIFTDPDFLETVREFLRKKEAPTPVEVEADEVIQRVRRMILLRMRKRYAEKDKVEGSITATAE